MVTSGKKRKPQSKPTTGIFKRPKAKVGKRAERAANETETSFKTSSLHISGQSLVHESANSLFSKRGKSLSTLSLQLGHPSFSVRLSALKGLNSIVKEKKIVSLKPHLHFLVQACSRTLVDESEDVRKESLSLLREILPQEKDPAFLPFIPLLVAYTSSALHSLDTNMRLDGARAVELLCLFPSFSTASYRISLLPPFVTLVMDWQKEKELLSVLKSLVLLLQTELRTSMTNFDSEDVGKQKPCTDFFCAVEGHSSNSFILTKTQRLRTSTPSEVLGTIKGECLNAERTVNEIISNLDKKKSIVAKDVVSNLQLKLHNLLVDTVEESSKNSAKIGVLFLNRTQCLVDAINLVWTLQPTNISQSTRKGKFMLSMRTLRLLEELFPFLGSTNSIDKSYDFEILNSTISLAILNLENISCPFVNDTKSKEEKQERIRSLITFWTSKPLSNEASVFSCRQLEVLSKILSLGSGMMIQKMSNKRTIIEYIHKTFFQKPTRMVARSVVGRKAALLISDMIQDGPIEHHSFEGNDDQILISMIQSLPVYLKAWASDFQNDASSVLKALRTFVLRTWPCATIVMHLRETLLPLLKPIQSTAISSNQPTSIFEEYNIGLQTSFLGLIRTLESPSQAMLKELARMCGKPMRTFFADDKKSLEHEIFWTVFAIRRTIALKDYLRFVVSSFSVPNAQAKNYSLEEIEGTIEILDYRISRGSRALVGCGALCSLRMLMPQFRIWLETESMPLDVASFLRLRVVFCMLATLMSNTSGSVESDALDLVQCSGLVDLLNDSVTIALSFVSKTFPPSILKEKLLAPISIVHEMSHSWNIKS